MKSPITILTLFLNLTLFGQDHYHETYSWDSVSALGTLSSEEKSQNVLIVKDLRVFEFDYSASPSPSQYETRHKIIYVNSDRSIEEYNKVFIPLTGREVLKIEARSISPDGTMRNIDPENIKEKSNLKGYGAYKLFAIEGVQKGGLIEYWYSIKTSLKLVGRETFQTDARIKDAYFEIITDKFVEPAAKSYNGLEKIKDTFDDESGTQHLVSHSKNVEALYEEKYAAYDANLARIDYKILNTSNTPEKDDYNSWMIIAADKYNEIYRDYDEKALKKILKTMKLKKKTESEKIRTIEKYIKSNFTYKKGRDRELSNVTLILANKYASDLGFTRLFAAFLSVAEIPHDILITSNRFKARFDPDFSSFLNTTEDLIYFRQYSKCIIPSMLYYRFGPVPQWFGNNYGLLVRKRDEKLVFQKKFIPLLDADLNKIESEIDISFADDLSHIVVNKENSSKGYRGVSNRTNYFFSDDKETYVKAIATYGGIDDVEILDFSVENAKLDDQFSQKGFRVKSRLKIASLLERTCEGYLFKAGMTIGTQSEMYQDHKRQNPIEMNHPMYYIHNIRIQIPEGYQPTGMEDIKIDRFIEDKEGNRILQFNSSYTFKDNVLHIRIEEFYKQISFDKTYIDQFRAVINAAADFNKVAIALEKIND